MYERRQHSFMSPGGHPLQFVYRKDTNDWNTLTSSLTEDEYGLAGRKITGHAIDIGGYLGSVGIALAADNPDLTVTIIEPIPANVELIHENVALNGLTERIKVIQAAAGDGTPTRIHYGFTGSEVGEHHAFVGNGTLAMSGTECPPDPHEHVDSSSVRLEDIPAADFLKIDCEGCEGEVLRSPASKRIQVIVGEYHPPVGKLGITRMLSKTHKVTFAATGGGAGGFVAVRR